MDRARERSGTVPRAMLVASTGGHVRELLELLPRFRPTVTDRVWVTFDSPISRLLADHGEDVRMLPYVQPRDAAGVIRNVLAVETLFRHDQIDRMITTGSNIALSTLPPARLRRIPCHYVESAARLSEPSLTGRIVQRIPGVRLYTQSPSWRDPRWHYRGRVTDAYVSSARGLPPTRIETAVVTLGTERFPFPALISAVARVLPNAKILWQTGATDVSQFGLATARPYLPLEELRGAMADADVVISHAGVGSATTALEVGKLPLLLPRRSSRGEHVDDHQVQTAGSFAEQGLAIVVEQPDDLTWQHVHDAARVKVARQSEAAAVFVLDE
jgi:UDP-N-acetylglucosamine--N-acetylmuramyl-(pentapeptide) pyrophosphoryl-undecaprenol N-acetylglucosamine transferase